MTTDYVPYGWCTVLGNPPTEMRDAANLLAENRSCGGMDASYECGQPAGA